MRKEQNIFGIDKTKYHSRSQSPSNNINQSKSNASFSLNPQKMSEESRDEYGNRKVGRGLAQFISSDQDQERSNATRDNRYQNSDVDPNEEFKGANYDASNYTPRNKVIDPSLLPENSGVAPFKIIRPRPKIWSNVNCFTNDRNPAESDFAHYYSHSALNSEMRNPHQQKSQRPAFYSHDLLKKIFKQMRIDSKINEYCQASGIK